MLEGRGWRLATRTRQTCLLLPEPEKEDPVPDARLLPENRDVLEDLRGIVWDCNLDCSAFARRESEIG